MVAIVNSTIILPTLVIVIVVFKIRKMFLKTSRNIKRLEAVGMYIMLRTKAEIGQNLLIPG